MAFFDEFLLERQVVLDDAVVHYHDLAGAVAVRVGVFFAGAAMGGPARMADAIGAVERLGANHFFQVAELALGAADLQAFPVAGDRDPSGVISAILQAAQPVNDDGDDLFFANVADDATHKFAPSPQHGRNHDGGAWPVRLRPRSGGYSSREYRYSSMTGLVRTSRAMRSTSEAASDFDRPSSSINSKY